MPPGSASVANKLVGQTFDEVNKASLVIVGIGQEATPFGIAQSNTHAAIANASAAIADARTETGILEKMSTQTQHPQKTAAAKSANAGTAS